MHHFRRKQYGFTFNKLSKQEAKRIVSQVFLHRRKTHWMSYVGLFDIVFWGEKSSGKRRKLRIRFAYVEASSW